MAYLNLKILSNLLQRMHVDLKYLKSTIQYITNKTKMIKTYLL